MNSRVLCLSLFLKPTESCELLDLQMPHTAIQVPHIGDHANRSPPVASFAAGGCRLTLVGPILNPCLLSHRRPSGTSFTAGFVYQGFFTDLGWNYRHNIGPGALRRVGVHESDIGVKGGGDKGVRWW